MHYDAALRVRELTQNIYDIGDEIAEYIDHTAQAIADWDPELLRDCLEELGTIIQQGRREVRPQLYELNGLRQAFVSGVRSGEMSASVRHYPHPGRTLSFMHKVRPSPSVVASEEKTADHGRVTSAGEIAEPEAMASTAAWRLWMRSCVDDLIGQLGELSEWVVEQTDLALQTQSVLLPQAYSQAQETTVEIAGAFGAIIDRQPQLAFSMRGEAPPAFLQERARVEAVITRILQRKYAEGSLTSGG